MENKILYLKIKQNIEVHNVNICLADITKLFCTDKGLVNDLNRLVIMKVNSNKNCKFIFSILKIIEIINNAYPEIEIQNLGETNFVVEYKIPKKPNIIFEYIKTFFVAISIFMGAAFTIMTFNTDVSVSKVFNIIYELIMNEPKTGPSVLELSYSIGLPIGIIVFFNHFSKFKLHDDPTPITIQMRLYEEDVNTTLIIDACREESTIDVDS